MSDKKTTSALAAKLVAVWSVLAVILIGAAYYLFFYASTQLSPKRNVSGSLTYMTHSATLLPVSAEEGKAPKNLAKEPEIMEELDEEPEEEPEIVTGPTEEELYAHRTQGFEHVLDDSTSTAAILIRYRNDDLGGVVAVKNGDEQLAPASMTKLLTTLILAEYAMENDKLEDIMTMPYGIYADLELVDASTAGYYSGEELTVKDCLYGILLPSGCDCCLAAAYYIAGSEEAFADIMNAKAEELGMTNSHFITCHGLYVEGHYTCANDMAKLLTACWENELVHDVLLTWDYTTSVTPTRPSGMHIENKLVRDLSTGFDDMVTILGGKTGFSRFVGQNLSTVGQVGDEIYLLVTIGAPGSPYNGDLMHHDDHRIIYNALAEVIKAGKINTEPLIPSPKNSSGNLG